MTTTTITRFGAIEREVSTTEDRLELLGDPDFQERALDYLETIVSTKDVQLLSLDVFDTLLLRNDKAELTRFYDIAKRISPIAAGHGPVPTPEAVLVARLLAARVAYRTGPSVHGHREGTIEEIHRLLLQIVGVPTTAMGATIGAELDYELTGLTPNPLLVRLAARHRERGGSLVLVSDMYLRPGHIEFLVDGLVPDLAGTPIFSSAVTKVSKRSGHLFDLVGTELDAEPGRALHVGDAVEGDYRSPARRGWNAVHLPVPEAQRRRIEANHAATLEALQTRGVRLGTLAPAP